MHTNTIKKSSDHLNSVTSPINMIVDSKSSSISMCKNEPPIDVDITSLLDMITAATTCYYDSKVVVCPLSQQPINNIHTNNVVSIGDCRPGPRIIFSAIYLVEWVNDHKNWLCPVTQVGLSRREVDETISKSPRLVTVSNAEFVQFWLSSAVSNPRCNNLEWMMTETNKKDLYNLVLSCIGSNSTATCTCHTNESEPLCIKHSDNSKRFFIGCWDPKMSDITKECLTFFGSSTIIRTIFNVYQLEDSTSSKQALEELNNLVVRIQDCNVLQRYRSSASILLQLVPASCIGMVLDEIFWRNVHQISCDESCSSFMMVCVTVLRYCVECDYAVDHHNSSTRVFRDEN